MKKYTANYTYTNPNFVIQNLEEKTSNSDLLPLYYVLKNILQRGFPTVMSRFLQEKIGQIHKKDSFFDRLLLVSDKQPKWIGTIKGSEELQYNPAKYFFENILANELGEYSFVHTMFVPEMPIYDIVDEENPFFIDQQVDFYLPQALLVIEIDGGQHVRNIALDRQRNDYLQRHGIETVRISTIELRTHNYHDKIARIIQRIEQFKKRFEFYRSAFEKAKNNSYSEEEIRDKMLPTAIIRFQLLLMDLLISGLLDVKKKWRFNILCEEPIEDFAQLAIEDVYVWLNNLVMLCDKHTIDKFHYDVKVSKKADFEYDKNAINIDFSLCQRYTDENTLNPEIIFVRSDYFDYSEKRILEGKGEGLDKNYFRVSTTSSINYHITDEDKPVLRFFLNNLFDKNDFRDGQFAIISNALNLRDTIGLLPTGGGKSLCFQLPCLLQPSINFVVCPIKALMYDQVANLKNGDVRISNINLLCGDQSAEERNRLMRDYSRGKYLFIWISPERFQIVDFRESLRAIISQFNISYAVIDEVHCMSEWGHDFRTSYLNLTKTIDNLSPKDENGEGRIKFIGLTATASLRVLKDIKIEFSRKKQRLEEDNIKTLIDYTRPELDFYVRDDNDQKWVALNEILTQEKISETTDKAVLIFTPNVNGNAGCYQLANNLERDYSGKVRWYSGSCPYVPGQKNTPIMIPSEFDKYKRDVQNDFKENKYNILCATKAFGMGIDKQNIYYTIHFGLPSSIEALYQEAGRAGRWDTSLSENGEKRGKCFVLHTHEYSQNQQYVNDIFIPNARVSSIQENIDAVKRSGRDIFTQLNLFVDKLRDPDEECQNIFKIINLFYQKGVTRTITYDEFHQIDGDLCISPDEFEKEIYRLCLLGIAKDWTRDFINSFTIAFNTTEQKNIILSLKNYIHKYDPDENVEECINAVEQKNCDSFVKKATWYLLDWIFRNITESRKQSLKTVSDWCLEYTDSESFKGRIEAYFTFNESVYILQHIAGHPHDYTQWFAAFYNNKTFITIPEIKTLKDRLSRQLESYHNSPGLNFVSGMVRLLLNEFEDTDGRPRMESALKFVFKDNHELSEDNEFIKGLIPFLKDAQLTEEALTDICTMMIHYSPSLTGLFADQLEMPWLYNDIIKENIQKLRTINIKLYEQIGRI